MINLETLKRLAVSQQTTEFNVAREYAQHLFLANFYRQTGTHTVMFKGGTALRIAYNSPRFSEDLDFSGFGLRLNEFEEWLLETSRLIEQMGVPITIAESKKTSGGYLGILNLTVAGHAIEILLEISLRKKNGLKGQGMLIANDFLPAYTLTLLPEEVLVEEKLTALLTRAKPRDFFDCYFMLRRQLISPKHKAQMKEIKAVVAKTRLNFKAELGEFLPRSHQSIINDFKNVLIAELARW